MQVHNRSPTLAEITLSNYSGKILVYYNLEERRQFVNDERDVSVVVEEQPTPGATSVKKAPLPEEPSPRRNEEPSSGVSKSGEKRVRKSARLQGFDAFATYKETSAIGERLEVEIEPKKRSDALAAVAKKMMHKKEYEEPVKKRLRRPPPRDKNIIFDYENDPELNELLQDKFSRGGIGAYPPDLDDDLSPHSRGDRRRAAIRFYSENSDRDVAEEHAYKEWTFIAIHNLDDMNSPGHCICGQERLRRLYQFKNLKDQVICLGGNCVLECRREAPETDTVFALPINVELIDDDDVVTDGNEEEVPINDDDDDEQSDNDSEEPEIDDDYVDDTGKPAPEEATESYPKE